MNEIQRHIHLILSHLAAVSDTEERRCLHDLLERSRRRMRVHGPFLPFPMMRPMGTANTDGFHLSELTVWLFRSVVANKLTADLPKWHLAVACCILAIKYDSAVDHMSEYQFKYLTTLFRYKSQCGIDGYVDGQTLSMDEYKDLEYIILTIVDYRLHKTYTAFKALELSKRSSLHLAKAFLAQLIFDEDIDTFFTEKFTERVRERAALNKKK